MACGGVLIVLRERQIELVATVAKVAVFAYLVGALAGLIVAALS